MLNMEAGGLAWPSNHCVLQGSYLLTVKLMSTLFKLYKYLVKYQSIVFSLWIKCNRLCGIPTLSRVFAWFKAALMTRVEHLSPEGHFIFIQSQQQ